MANVKYSAIFCLCYVGFVYAEPQEKVLFILKDRLKVNHQFILNQIVGLKKRSDFEVAIHIPNEPQASLPENLVPVDVVKYNLNDCTYYNYLPKKFHSCRIILCQFGTLARYSLNLKKKYAVPAKIIVFFRGSDINDLSKMAKGKREALFKDIDCFAPVCQAFKRDLLKLGCPRQKIIIIPSAIDCKKFTRENPLRQIRKEDKIDILSVCRLEQKKGLDIAIRSLVPLLKRYPHLHYTIVGDGNERVKLQKLINQYKIGRVVHLIGWKTQDETKHLLEKAHIFLLPSVTAHNGTREGIPNAIKEAMCMELPAVCTQHSGIPEVVVDGYSGFLVKERNVNQLTKKLIYVIEHPVMAIKVGKQAREVIKQHYNIEIEIEKLARICKSFALKDQ